MDLDRENKLFRLYQDEVDLLRAGLQHTWPFDDAEDLMHLAYEARNRINLIDTSSGDPEENINALQRKIVNGRIINELISKVVPVAVRNMDTAETVEGAEAFLRENWEKQQP